MVKDGTVREKCCQDIEMELVLIEYCGCVKCWSGEDSCLKRCCNLFVSKDWMEVMRVH